MQQELALDALCGLGTTCLRLADALLDILCLYRNGNDAVE